MIFTEGFSRIVSGDNTHYSLKWDGAAGNLGSQAGSFYPIISGRFEGTSPSYDYSGGIDWNPRKAVTSDNHYIIGMAIQVQTYRSDLQMFGTMNSSTRLLSVRLSSDGLLRLNLNTTNMYQHNAPMLPGRWYYVEVEHKVHATAGILKLWIDEVLVYSQTTGDTRGGTGLSDITHFDLWQYGSTGASVGFDDLYYITSTGATLPWGDTHVKEILPTSDNLNSGFTLSTGTDIWDILNNQSVGATTPNITASVVGDKFLVDSSMTVGNSPVIRAVATNSRIIKSDSGSRSVAPLLKIAGVEYEGTSIAVPTPEDYLYEPLTLSPASGTIWSKSEVETMTFGLKVTA